MKEFFCATFSIVAFDATTNSWGIAVASKYLAIGRYVPYAKAGVGAIATQSYTNVEFGPKALELLSEGKNAQEVVDALFANDTHPDVRQLGIVDTNGNAAAFTGNKCAVWAGQILGNGYAIQGNMLANERVLLQMEKTYLSTKGDIAQRLFLALQAGDKAGGDTRGKQAASLLVVKDTTFNKMKTDRYIDLRVDDHTDPVEELGRLLTMQYELLKHEI